ncbi:hypothetical protein [Infirmifilum sp. NZ]|uniref:hypothetical protein n=1 Tax=Infirmifilum sp. NZ TaxID=2926850 RepID=UPI0027A0EE33|nr:hypothetical protein [Infirmifilum sp. NZ]UNQ73519.1 hypothetical protein MOV14_00550 [Infirmifilum sp. NZ]
MQRFYSAYRIIILLFLSILLLVSIVVTQQQPVVPSAQITIHDYVKVDLTRGSDSDGDGLREFVVEISIPSLPSGSYVDVIVERETAQAVSATLVSPDGKRLSPSAVWDGNYKWTLPSPRSGTYKLYLEEAQRGSGGVVRVMAPVYAIQGDLIATPVGNTGAPAKWSCYDLFTSIDEEGYSPVVWQVSPQTVNVNPGQEFELSIKLDIRQFSYLPPGIIWQVFLVYSWAPSWPPPEGYYVKLFDGIPTYGGTTIATFVKVKAPQEPGTYYIYICVNQHYGIRYALQGVTRQPQPPAHAKVIVQQAPQPPSPSIACGGQESIATDKSTYLLGENIQIKINPTPLYSAPLLYFIKVFGPDGREIQTINTRVGVNTYSLQAGPTPGRYRAELWLCLMHPLQEEQCKTCAYTYFDVVNPTRSLIVRIHNAPGLRMPSGGSLEITLYKSTGSRWAFVESRVLDYSGGVEYVPVSLSNIELNSQYLIEVVHRPSSGLRLREYWGWYEFKLTASNSTAILDFYRMRPYIVSVVYPTSVQPDSTMSFEVTVRNLDVRTRDLYITAILDKDLSQPFDVMQNSSVFSLSPGETKTVKVTLKAPKSPGRYTPYVVLSLYYPSDPSAHGTVYDQFNGITNQVEVQSPANKPPVAYIDSVSPNPATEGDVVRFRGHGYDPDGQVVECEWRSSLDGFLSSACSFETSKLSAGTHTIYFRVKDDSGAWSNPVSVELTVRKKQSPAPPSPSSKLSVQILSPKADDTIYLQSILVVTRVLDANGQPAGGVRVQFELSKDGTIIGRSSSKTNYDGYTYSAFELSGSGSYILSVYAVSGDASGVATVSFRARPISILVKWTEGSGGIMGLSANDVSVFSGKLDDRLQYIYISDVANEWVEWEHPVLGNPSLASKLITALNRAIASGKIRVKVSANAYQTFCEDFEFTLNLADALSSGSSEVAVGIGVKEYTLLSCKLKVTSISPEGAYEAARNLAIKNIKITGDLWNWLRSLFGWPRVYYLTLEIQNTGSATTVIPTAVLVSASKPNAMRIEEARITKAPDVGGEVMRLYRELGKLAFGMGPVSDLQDLAESIESYIKYGSEAFKYAVSMKIANNIINDMVLKEEPYIWAPEARTRDGLETFAPLRPGDSLEVVFKIVETKSKSLEGSEIKVLVSYVEIERVAIIDEFPLLEHITNLIMRDLGLTEQQVGTVSKSINV